MSRFKLSRSSPSLRLMKAKALRLTVALVLGCLVRPFRKSAPWIPKMERTAAQLGIWKFRDWGEGEAQAKSKEWPGYTTKDRSWWFMEHDFLAFWQPWETFVAYHQDARSLPTPGPTPLVSVAWVQHGVLMALVPRPKLGLPVGIPGPPVGSPPLGSPPPAPPAPAPARDLGGERNLYGLKTSKKHRVFFRSVVSSSLHLAYTTSLRKDPEWTFWLSLLSLLLFSSL